MTHNHIVFTLYGIGALQSVLVANALTNTSIAISIRVLTELGKMQIDIIFLILKILGIFVALLVGTVIVIPKILHAERLWKSRGSIEGIVTASFFGRIAAIVGLLLEGLSQVLLSKET